MTLIVNELDKSERQKKISFMVALKNHDVSTNSFLTALYRNFITRISPKLSRPFDELFELWEFPCYSSDLRLLYWHHAKRRTCKYFRKVPNILNRFLASFASERPQYSAVQNIRYYSKGLKRCEYRSFKALVISSIQ